MKLLFLLLLIVQVHAAADVLPAKTQEVFQLYKDRIFQIRIMDRDSGAKVSIGSGFAVHASGKLMTNYHVIADLVLEPELHRAEFIHPDGSSGRLQLLQIDLIRDLAVLQLQEVAVLETFFTLWPDTMAQGTPLYSLGNPHDLGLTIVEGTYNGLLTDSLYEKIHFTGSINPGMSGGPTILANGRVIGINVATSGNQISFLVPARHAQVLLQRALQEEAPPKDFIAELQQQLWANQEQYMQRLLAAPMTMQDLGAYRIPDRFLSIFRCWGETSNEKDKPYALVYHTCATDDDIFVTDSQDVGLIKFVNYWITTTDLNRFRFAKLNETVFSRNYSSLSAEEEDVGGFVCQRELLKNQAGRLKIVLCARAYKRLKGLYDVIFRSASMDFDDQMLHSTLVLSGVSFANALAFGDRYFAHVKMNTKR